MLNKFYLLTLIVLVFASSCKTVKTTTEVPKQKYSSGLVPAAGWGQNYGTVKRIYASATLIYFSIEGGESSMNPKNGYYYISTSHPNYTALKDLLYLAAEKRYVLRVRTENELDENGTARVQYLVVDW